MFGAKKSEKLANSKGRQVFFVGKFARSFRAIKEAGKRLICIHAYRLVIIDTIETGGQHSFNYETSDIQCRCTRSPLSTRFYDISRANLHLSRARNSSSVPLKLEFRRAD